jgi:hypothetical protein
MGILSSPSQRQRYFDLGSTTGAPLNGKTAFAIGMKPCDTLPRYEKPKPQTAEEVVEQAIQSGV